MVKWPIGFLQRVNKDNDFDGNRKFSDRALWHQCEENKYNASRTGKVKIVVSPRRQASTDLKSPMYPRPSGLFQTTLRHVYGDSN